jgi:hypothetical protein
MELGPCPVQHGHSSPRTLKLPFSQISLVYFKMVHIVSQSFVLAALVASSRALSLSKRSTAADVKADLKSISAQMTTLDNAIKSFPTTCNLKLALVRRLEI